MKFATAIVLAIGRSPAPTFGASPPRYLRDAQTEFRHLQEHVAACESVDDCGSYHDCASDMEKCRCRNGGCIKQGTDCLTEADPGHQWSCTGVCVARPGSKNWGTCDDDKLRVPASPPLPGVSNDNKMKPKVILAQDIDYPPYTSIGADLELSGFGPDFAKGLEEVCHIETVLVEARWGDCWGSNVIGQGLLNGHYHGCTTYTHTKGVRNRYLEFSAPIVSMNKAAGILTRLEDGVPVVDGTSSLSGVNVGDVTGWAPTADTLGTSTNQCTQSTFSNFNLVSNNSTDRNANDAALEQLLVGETDALWIYADQANNYKSACDEDPAQVWDCDLWSKFKTDFAYVQTGIYDYMAAGTTLAISKKGSGLAATLNPCIEAFIQTESYKELCEKYDMEDECFKNEFFEDSSEEMEDFSKPTSELTTACTDGYCPCPTV